MKAIPTKIHGAYLIRPEVFSDNRGIFLESWNREAFRQLGIDGDFIQENCSKSSRHVLRGLHYQAGDAAQAKLAWVNSGMVFDVIVDLRHGSPTFGRWEGRILQADHHDRLYIPAGCAHGFMVLSDACDFVYLVTRPYSAQAERSLRWNDPELAIGWPLAAGEMPILSSKDSGACSFADCEKFA